MVSKTEKNYKNTYKKLTKNKSPTFKINFLTGALATTNNKRIRQMLKTEQNKQRGIRWRKK